MHNVESDEENRPEFETNATSFRMNPVTREKEPYMSTWTRAIRFVITGSAVLFMVSEKPQSFSHPPTHLDNIRLSLSSSLIQNHFIFTSTSFLFHF